MISVCKAVGLLQSRALRGAGLGGLNLSTSFGRDAHDDLSQQKR